MIQLLCLSRVVMTSRSGLVTYTDITSHKSKGSGGKKIDKLLVHHWQGICVCTAGYAVRLVRGHISKVISDTSLMRRTRFLQA